MFELTRCCTLDKNLDLILQSLSKDTEKYFPSLDASSLDWVRHPVVLRAFESAELTAADDDELGEIRNDRRLKLKHSSTDMASFWLFLRQETPIIKKKETEALFNRYGLILVVPPTGDSHHHKEGD
jgi:hypothetical protein